MAEERRIQASLDFIVSNESHRSLDDWLKKCERAEAMSRSIRENLGGGLGGGSGGGGIPSGPGGSGGGGGGPSVPWPGGGSQGRGSGQGSGSGGGGRARGQRVYDQSDDAMFGPGGPLHRRPFWGDRPQMGDYTTNYDGGTPPPPSRIPFRGAVPAQFYQTHLTPTRIPAPQEQASAGGMWDARNSRWDLPDHLQTMNKFGDRSKSRYWGQTAYDAVSSIGTGARAFGMAQQFAMRAAGPVAAVATAGALADAYHSERLVGLTGGNQSERIRAGLSGTWLTRQGLGIVDQFSGRSQGIAYEQYKSRFGMIDAQTREEMRTFQNEIQRQRSPLDRAREVRAADTRYAELGQFDRRTTRGEREYREAQAMIPVQRERFESERSLSIDQKVLADLKSQEKRLIDQRTAGEFEMGKIAISGDSKRSGAEGIADIAKWTQLSIRQAGIVGELTVLQNKIESKKSDVVNATVRLNQVSVAELRTRAANAEARADTARGQAGQLGSMNPADVSMGIANLQAIQQAGTLTGFTEQMIEKVRRVDPQFVAKLEQKRGIEYEATFGLVKNRVGSFEDQLPAAEETARKLQNAAEKVGVEVGAVFAKMAAEMLLSPEFTKALTAGMLAKGNLDKGKVQAEQGARNVVGN